VMLYVDGTGALVIPETPIPEAQAEFHDATGQQLPAGAPPPPHESGCYVWLPSGCPMKPFHAKFFWRRDDWGEANEKASESSAACGVRKAVFDMWCHTTDAVMMYLDDTYFETHETPVATGEEAMDEALVVPQTPLGSDAGAADSSETHPTPEAQVEIHDATGQQLPEGAPPPPHAPGCYVWTPTGCRKKHAHAKFNWRLDTGEEDNRKANESSAACSARKAVWDSWCHRKDAVMIYLDGSYHETADTPMSKDEEEAMEDSLVGPETPLGNDAGAEDSSETKAPEAEAEIHDSTRLQLPEGAPPPPHAPGCYVWIPTGCRKKSFHAKFNWRRDEWGEANMKAKESSAACGARKAVFDGWCHNTDVVMMHVDGTVALVVP